MSTGPSAPTATHRRAPLQKRSSSRTPSPDVERCPRRSTAARSVVDPGFSTRVDHALLTTVISSGMSSLIAATRGCSRARAVARCLTVMLGRVLPTGRARITAGAGSRRFAHSPKLDSAREEHAGLSRLSNHRGAQARGPLRRARGGRPPGAPVRRLPSSRRVATIRTGSRFIAVIG